jgi:hypothetical protein
MPTAALISGGLGALGSIGGGLIGANASLRASGQQVALGQQALATQAAMFGDVQNNLQPYISTGNQAGSVLTSLLTPGPNQTAALSQIPGFQFAQNWGQKAVQNLGTTTGLGGNTLTAGANYATGLAQQNFGQLVNPLLSLYGTGESAGAALGGVASNFGSTIGSTLGNIGNSMASGTLGSANALSGALGGVGGSVSSALLLSKLLGGGNLGGPGAGGGANGVYSGNNILNDPALLNYNQGAIIGGGP